MLKKLLKAKKDWAQSIKKYNVRTVRTSNEVLDMCRKCFSFRYGNEWHFERPKHLLENDPDEKIFVRFSQCPSCVEESLAMYDVEFIQNG